jgi:hypothetical protein
LEADFGRLGLELAALEESFKIVKGLKLTFKMNKLAKTLPDDRSETLVPLLNLLEGRILRSTVISSRLGSLKASGFCVDNLK